MKTDGTAAVCTHSS